MKTFEGWRVVGAAMRWARQQPGVQQQIDHGKVARQHRWNAPGADGSIVAVTWGWQAPDLDIYATGGRSYELAQFTTAAHALTLLAALDLIPAELAEVADA